MDPFGAGGMSHVEYGMCPIDALRDNSDLRKMAAAKLLAFDSHTHGQFFWNFRTELEPKWDYQQVRNRDELMIIR